MASYDDVMTALRNADASGNKEDAQRLAKIASTLKSQSPAAPSVPARTGAAAIPVGGTQEAPTYADQQPVAPARPESTGVSGFLKKMLGGAETAAAVGTGATTGLGLGVASAVDNAVKHGLYKLSGMSTEGLPSAEKAFTGGVQAGTYAPRTAEGKEQTEAVAHNVLEPVAEVSNALGPLGAEVGAGLKGLSNAVKGTRDLGVAGSLKAVPGVEQAGNAVKNVGEIVGNAAAKVVSKVTPGITPETAATVQKAAKFGIDLPPDAFSKNKFAKIVGETARNVPASGAGNEANAIAFNKVLARKIGAGDAEKITPKVFDEAMTQSGDTIGRITEANDIPLPNVEDTLKTLREASAKRSEGVGQAVEGYLKDIEAKAQENGGVIPGAAMQQIVSDLGKDAFSSTNGNVRNALGELHSALVGDVAKVLSPEDAKVLQKAKKEYSAALMIVPLIRPDGHISPAMFNQAFRSNRAGKMRVARGTGGELGDLAEVSQYMREPGSSLTAERAAVYGALGGGGMVSAPAAVGGVGAANAYNRLGPRVLREKAGVGKGAPGGSEPPTGVMSPEPSTPGAPSAPESPAPTVPTDPRLAEVAKLRENAKSDAVKAALDEHEKTVQKTIKAEETVKKQAQDVAELEAAAKAAGTPELKATLLAKAEELRPQKPVPAEAASEVVEPVAKPPEPIPTGEATELAPEVIAPAKEMAWAKEHGLAGPEIDRAKNVAKALELDERAVEKAAFQHERSPIAFDREINRIIEQGNKNASESKQVAQSGESATPGNNVSRATETPVKQSGTDSAAKTGARSESNSSSGQGTTRGVDKKGSEYSLSVKHETLGADKKTKAILVEARDPETGARRGFVDFAIRDDGTLVAENVKVAPEFKQRGIAELMYRAARGAGHDIAPGRVQTKEGLGLVESLQKKGVINKEAEGKRFSAGDLDLSPIDGETIPGEKATRPEPKGFEKGKNKGN